MPPPEEIVARVLAAHHIREEDGKPVDITMLVKWKGDLMTFQGVAYLEPKNARTFFSWVSVITILILSYRRIDRFYPNVYNRSQM